MSGRGSWLCPARRGDCAPFDVCGRDSEPVTGCHTGQIRRGADSDMFGRCPRCGGSGEAEILGGERAAIVAGYVVLGVWAVLALRILWG